MGIDNGYLLANSVADDSQIISETPVISGFDVENIASARPELSYRAPGNQAHIKIVFNGAEAIDSYALCRTNLTYGATAQIKLYSDVKFQDEIVRDEEDAVTADLTRYKYRWGEFLWGQIIWPGYEELPHGYSKNISGTFSKEYYARSAEIIINNPNADGYFIEINRLKIGKAFRPEWNFNWAGNLKINQAQFKKYRETEISWSALDNAESIVMTDLIKSHGSKQAVRTRSGVLIGHVDDIFVDLYPEQKNTALRFHNRALMAITEWSGAEHTRSNENVINLNLSEVFNV